MLRARLTLQRQNDTTRLRVMSMKRHHDAKAVLGAGATGLFAAEVGSFYFDDSTHLIQT
jgi:hypothetical protein